MANSDTIWGLVRWEGCGRRSLVIMMNSWPDVVGWLSTRAGYTVSTVSDGKDSTKTM